MDDGTVSVKFAADMAALDAAFAAAQQRVQDFAARLGAISAGIAAGNAQARSKDVADDAGYRQKLTTQAAAAARQQEQALRDQLQGQARARQELLQDERVALDQEVDDGKISVAERLEIERGHEQAAYALEKQGLEQRLALQGLSVAEQRDIDRQLETLEQQHEAAMARFAEAAARQHKAERDKERQEQLQQNAEIASMASGMLTGMLTRRESFSKAITRLGDELLQKGLNWAIREALQWVEGETVKTAATEAGTVARSTAELAGAATAKAATVSTASTGIMAKAADAAAGSFEAMSGIPIVGPALGAAAAAATYAAVIAYDSLFSAASGWGRVPYDNALTALHKDEMVLPARYAAVIRGLGESAPGWGMAAAADPAGAAQAMAGNAGAGGDFAPQITHNLSISNGPQGMSDRDFRRLLSRNADHMVGMLANLHRNSAGR